MQSWQEPQIRIFQGELLDVQAAMQRELVDGQPVGSDEYPLFRVLGMTQSPSGEFFSVMVVTRGMMID